MKALKIEANKAGLRYAIIPLDGAYSVWVEGLNYASHVHGGMSKTWRYCEKGMTLEAAEAMFARKIKGTRRA